MKGSLRLLILLVIFLSQYICAEDYLKDAHDGQPRAQYLYAMNLLKKGNKNEALDWLIIAAAQGHLRSSLWIEQNMDYRKDKFMRSLIETNKELKKIVKLYTPSELKELQKIGKDGNSDTQFLLWLLYINNLHITKPKAYIWIKKAAFNKHPRANFAVGLLYYYGYIVPKQKSKAIILFKESTVLGYSFAATFLDK
ncbi:sel1 repeat family protein [Methylophilaceae bacterium]|nr:sel1 repeat family protein [Methylophilaceae bacterium]MDA9155346.1 sel1 repeat family protein [Methylophilaceae bacterium]